MLLESWCFMKLNEFLKVFKVDPPYFLRVMHHGSGQLYCIQTGMLVRDEWLNCDVVALGSSQHRYLGSLLKVEIHV